ncbi:MAG TPA: cupredoxin family protein [Casimicrobiaceae bacterium]|nr:cupredoxin family protein [Casimicrobiaceae bacterium]
MHLRNRLTIVTSFVCVLGTPVFAHGTEAHGPATKKQPTPAEQKAFGTAGNPVRVTRTIDMKMTDEMRFEPSVIKVKAGETVRFRLFNVGRVMHEMVIGTRAELLEHAALMRKFPGMEHDEPYMTHVAAGKRGEIVWRFNRVGEFEFACLISGHFEAGMRGTISVAAN